MRYFSKVPVSTVLPTPKTSGVGHRAKRGLLSSQVKRVRGPPQGSQSLSQGWLHQASSEEVAEVHYDLLWTDIQASASPPGQFVCQLHTRVARNLG